MSVLDEMGVCVMGVRFQQSPSAPRRSCDATLEQIAFVLVHLCISTVWTTTMTDIKHIFKPLSFSIATGLTSEKKNHGVMLTRTAKLYESQLVYIWISFHWWELSHDLVISWLQLFRAPLHSATLQRRIQWAKPHADSRPRITVQTKSKEFRAKLSELKYLKDLFWRFYFVNQSQQLSDLFWGFF